MKRILESLCVLLALAAVSCDKVELDDPATLKDGPCKIELTARVEGATRITETEDPVSGLRTAWSPGEELNVLFFNGSTPEIAYLRSTPGNGKFSGEVESGTAAIAFETGDLYCVNVSSRITTALSEGSMLCTVDLSGQKGTFEDIAQRELMFVKGRSKDYLQFEHQTSVLKLCFSGLPGSSIQKLTLSFTTEKGRGSTSLFASRARYKVGPGGVEAESDDLTFYEMTGMDVPVVSGQADVYLVVPARGKLHGELSILVTCADGGRSRTFRRYVKLNGKSFKASYVVARKEKVTSENEVPNIGDYVYSDGSWGPLVYYEDKWPQAVIFSNYTSKSDREEGYTHGYAMALRDAAWPTPWAPETEAYEHPDYPETDNVFESISISAPMQMMDNLDGLTTNRGLNDTYLYNYTQGNYYGMPGFVNNGSKAAIPCAMRYGKEDWVSAYEGTPNIAAFEAPAGTSGWFLPSVGQWYLCLSGLAGIDPEDLKMTTSGSTVTQLSWEFPSSNERQVYLDAFCRYFDSDSYNNPILNRYETSGRMVSTSFYLPYNGLMDWYLWACDEATSGTAAVVYLNATDIVFKYVLKETGEGSNNGYAARSILAF